MSEPNQSKSAAIQATVENLREVSRRQSAEWEKRKAHLEEAARAYLAAALEGEPTDPTALYLATEPLTRAFHTVTPHDNMLPANRDGMIEYLMDLTYTDRVALADAFLQAAADHFGRPLTLADFPEGAAPRPEGKRVCYVRGHLADRAFAPLTEALGTPSVQYRESFREVADDVENGYADYGILPLSADGAPLHSVTELIGRHGLHLVDTLRLPSEEGEGTAFALLCRSAATLSDEVDTFSFRFVPVEEEALPALLRCLSVYGGRLLACNTAPLSYNTARFLCTVTLGGDETVFCRLLSYLTLFVPGFATLGFYRELDPKGDLT